MERRSATEERGDEEARDTHRGASRRRPPPAPVPGAIQCVSYLLQDETTLTYNDQQGLTQGRLYRFQGLRLIFFPLLT